MTERDRYFVGGFSTEPSLPWEDPALYPEPLPDRDFGYLQGKAKLIAATPDELYRRCEQADVQLVWTPATPHLVPPSEVPGLEDALQTRARRRFWLYTVIIALLLIVLLATAHISTIDPTLTDTTAPDNFIVTVLASVLAPALAFGIALWQYRRQFVEPGAIAATRTRYFYWLRSRRFPLTNLAINVCCVLFILMIANLPEAVEAAALDKAAVRNGEIWRLLTGALLHGGGLHLLSNMIILRWVGREVEVSAHRAFVPLVLFVSMLAGSLSSYFLLPETSVGISGGVLGLLGYLFIFRWKARRLLPRGLALRFIFWIVWFMVDGLLSQGIVDNAAHVGGLLAGMAIGWLAVPAQPQSVPLRIHPLLEALGYALLGAFVIAAIGTGWLLVTA
ncbi:MAG: rhomboid family intramembrane serine protease [Chloroflexota bacterium]|nr:rhomboid family intramembrane serine protease [Chloroflexota bacterium]